MEKRRKKYRNTCAPYEGNSSAAQPEIFLEGNIFLVSRSNCNNSRSGPKGPFRHRNFGSEPSAVGTLLSDNPTGYFSEADPIALAFTPTADRYTVAVLEPLARLAVRQSQRFCATPR